MAAQGRTVLVSSHLLAEMALLADDLIIITAGQLAASGTVVSVASSMTGPVRTLVRTPDAEKLAAAIGVDAIITPSGDGDVYVTGADAAAIGDAAQRAGIAIHQLITERPDLEDAFLELTRARAAIR
jgi:ABC-2 type transport system ATP-binding protein